MNRKIDTSTSSNNLFDGSRRGFLKNTILAATGTVLFSSFQHVPGTLATFSGSKRKLKPELYGDWWLIGPPPPVSADIPAEVPKSKEEIDRICEVSGMSKEDCLKYAQKEAGKKSRFEPVDHHVFRGPDGYWHLWGCIRGTGYGRILYHWRAKNITDSPWEFTGEFFRCDPKVGECIDDWGGKEWIQSPYIISENGKYYMFYGGHSTGRDATGVPVSGLAPDVHRSEGQMCLMISNDGLKWQRHLFKDGLSRLFVGPGEARDPCLLKVDDLWYMYYAGYEGGDLKGRGGIFVRTSRDLINWSPYKLAHRDATFGKTSWDHECPHVVFKDGYFYLFRTESYWDANTYVYRSENPLDFGTDEKTAQPLLVGKFPVAAAELYEVDGVGYVSSNHDPAKGTQMSRMRWVADK
jgi:hypothetical protein